MEGDLNTVNPQDIETISVLKDAADGSDMATVSSPDKSEYLRPYQKNAKQNGYNGLTWKMAHYLSPVMVNQFLLTAPDGKTISTSPIYQNAYWPVEADQPAEK